MDLFRFQFNNVKLSHVNVAHTKPPNMPYPQASLNGVQNSDEYPTEANQIEFAQTAIAWRANKTIMATMISKTTRAVLLVTVTTPFASIVLIHAFSVLFACFAPSPHPGYRSG